MGQGVELTQKKRGKRLHYGWVILVAGMLVVGGALGLARFGFGINLPSMQQGLGLTHNQTGFIADKGLDPVGEISGGGLPGEQESMAKAPAVRDIIKLGSGK